MKPPQYTTQAKKDLENIYDYIAEDNPNAAIRVIEYIEDRCRFLSQFPRLGKIRPEIKAELRSHTIETIQFFTVFGNLILKLSVSIIRRVV